ncbi:hypothetical protein EDB84DRAFT_1511344 [Lactarius hengduanensis]|nr:hypothetical protein EDB84DRAFT_1511344 [Lactarius hengduanensis]
MNSTFPCTHRSCKSTFKSRRGRKCHLSTVHVTSNRRPRQDSPDHARDTGRAPVGQRIEHSHLTALPCDQEGNFLPPGVPPHPRERALNGGDWEPFADRVQFELADLVYRRAELSAPNIDAILNLWAQSMSEFDASAPFKNHEEMHAIIDSSALGDIPWECLMTIPSEDIADSESAPASWMRTTYEVWYRNPDAVVSAMLDNPDFEGQFDLRPYVDLDAKGVRRWNNVMSGNVAWRNSNEIFVSNSSTEGAMYCPLILGSDKTTVSVATGNVEYHPVYLSLGNPHNTVRRAHRNAVIPIAFLAIPKRDRGDDSPRFRVFKRQLYHASLAEVLSPLRPWMTTPVVRRCPDGHFRRVIFDLIAFIADYPEQMMLTGLIQGWCAKCTALSTNLDVYAVPRTPNYTETLRDILDSRTLWDEHGIDDDIVPFTSNFPRANIYQMISPDLLHQVIKGTFKDNLVDWVCDFLVIQHGETRAGVILDDIDRRIAAVPAFPGLRRFPHGRRFKQWTGDDSKALMKVYLPAIVGYVPDDIVKCLSAFLEACYISRRQDIDSTVLDTLQHTLDNFKELREVFRTSGVRPTGFTSLPRQHSIFHYRRQIEDFGAPGGLCSSITESRHITAVKKPWRRSNRYQALGQMLLINQRLDKLAAMRSDFFSRDLLLGLHLGVSQAPHPQHTSTEEDDGGEDDGGEDDGGEDDGEDDDVGPMEENVLGHVSLARTRAPNYPDDIEGLSLCVGEPNLPYLTQECIGGQLGISPDAIVISTCKISVFHSAVATFFALSDISGAHGMRRERIRSTPSWRRREPRRDCAFVIEDDTKPGMLGMNVVRVQQLFSLIYDDLLYPCALVEWFTRMNRDPVTGMWVVCPDITRGTRDRTVIHLDSILRGAHLIPAFGNDQLPLDFHFSYSLDVFKAYYVNKYIDHHTHEIAF